MNKIESPKSQLCTVFSQESNEHPIGSGFSWGKCLVVEVPTPWDSQITQSKHFPEGLETILDNAEVRFRQGGESCRPRGRKQHHSLKKLMQERGIPSWERDRIPLVYHEKKLRLVWGYWECL